MINRSRLNESIDFYKGFDIGKIGSALNRMCLYSPSRMTDTEKLQKIREAYADCAVNTTEGNLLTQKEYDDRVELHAGNLLESELAGLGYLISRRNIEQIRERADKLKGLCSAVLEQKNALERISRYAELVEVPSC